MMRPDNLFSDGLILNQVWYLWANIMEIDRKMWLIILPMDALKTPGLDPGLCQNTSELKSTEHAILSLLALNFCICER